MDQPVSYHRVGGHPSQKRKWTGRSAGYMHSTLNLGSNLAGKLRSNFRRGDPKDLDMTFTNFKRMSPSSTKKFIVIQKRGARTRKQVIITSVITPSESEANMPEVIYEPVL